jgi:hypothetical protein
MLPECEVFAPWDRRACGYRGISASQCQRKQGTCCYDDTYTFKNTNTKFCYKQSNICNVAPADRVDCGWPGITADRCLARGCCFDDTLDAIWCYRKP